MYVDVILPLPLEGLFTYSVPAELEQRVQPYVRVKVPLGISKTYTALVTAVKSEYSEAIQTKPILSVLDDEPVILPSQYRLWQWMSDYYMSPLGDIFVAALPHGMKEEQTYRPRRETYVTIGDDYHSEAALMRALDILTRSPRQLSVFTEYLHLSGWETGRQVTDISREELMNVTHSTSAIIKALTDRGMLKLYDKEVGRLNTSLPPRPENIKPLNEGQQKAYNTILSLQGINYRHTEGEQKKPEQPKNILLHGVTSSGKTEIYIHLIQDAIDRGEQVLYLLPEIALTVQITQRLQHVFGSRLGIYHSKYSDAERVEIWQKQLSAQPYDIILGARSAVLLPFQRLGLVIVDEEHETSFKQQDPSPRYHARAVAQMMARWAGARVVLGTATPSAETYYNATNGKYGLVTMTKRYGDMQLPKVEIVDTHDLRRRKIMRGSLSPQLKDAVHDALNSGRQAILFLNRRGFSHVIECRQCGWSPQCPHCDVSLTYHKTQAALTCHYCGYTYRMPTVCPECGNRDLIDRGAGTEKIEETIAETFPEARIARMDLDTTRTRNAYERIIAEFASGKTNLLIGTQMVTKGLDFGGVSVVGILSADSMLHQPDFRAEEHAFTMMTQVAGRAGRKGQQGRVILQTANPKLPVIRQIVNADYKGFFTSLMQERRDFHYPPFTRLIAIYLKHRNDDIVNTAAIELGSRLRTVFGDMVLGPDRPSVARIKNMYIRKILLKLPLNLSISGSRQSIRTAVNEMKKDKRYTGINLYYDVDPS